MSLVGPRPLMKFDFDKLPSEAQKYFYNVKPGLTGIASIVFRNEEKLHSHPTLDPHEIDRMYIAPYKGELELWYQQNISLYTDLMLLFLTLAAVFNTDNTLPYTLFKSLPEKSPQFKQFLEDNLPAYN